MTHIKVKWHTSGSDDSHKGQMTHIGCNLQWSIKPDISDFG